MLTVPRSKSFPEILDPKVLEPQNNTIAGKTSSNFNESLDLAYVLVNKEQISYKLTCQSYFLKNFLL